MIKRTPRERACALWRWAFAAAGAAVIVVVVSGFLPAGSFLLSIAAAGLFVAAIIVGAMAANATTKKPELVWIVAGILVFWVANSALYLHLIVEANTMVGTVPPQSVIDLLSVLFTAGTTAIVAAGILAVVGWVLRPGRWLASHGPEGQS